MIKRSGYIWKTYGFTRFHLWGISCTAGLLVGIATVLLAVVLKEILYGRTEHLLIFVWVSIAASLLAIEIILFSGFMLLFFLGAERLGLLERKSS